MTTATVDEFSGKSLGGVLWQLACTPAFVWLTIGATCVTVVAMGRNFWEPTFLRRVYGMDAAEAGLWYALISPLPAALGAWLCASLTDRLAARDRRWYGWFPALSALLLVPLGLAFYLAPADVRVAGVPIGFFFSVAASLSATAFALCQQPAATVATAPMMHTTTTIRPVCGCAASAATVLMVIFSSSVGSAVLATLGR